MYSEVQSHTDSNSVCNYTEVSKISLEIFSTGEEWQKARKLQDKMKSNLENTRDRLDELGM